MNKLNEIEDKLNELLPLWFEHHANNNDKSKDFWNTNKTAAILKSNFKNWHHWKNKSKGRKYAIKAKENKIIEEKAKQLEIERAKALDF